jgi:DNA-binding XRE family transcriptional regulator
MDFSIWFPARLKQLRLDSGNISQAVLAEECGIGVATYERLERGKCYPRIDTCILLAKYYNIPLSDLFVGYTG